MACNQNSACAWQQCAHMHGVEDVLTLPLWPLRFPRHSQVYVLYNDSVMPFTAAKYWPPLLKATSLHALMATCVCGANIPRQQQVKPAVINHLHAEQLG